VDVVISNCVINLSLDKDRVLAEAFRVLRPGGRFAVSDIVFQGDRSLIPDHVMRSIELWAGCIAGALEEREYLGKLRSTGFADAGVEVTQVYDTVPEGCGVDLSDIPDGIRVVSAFVRATKPAG